MIPVEQTNAGHDRVRLDVSPGAGAHIRRRGEVLTTGAPLLAPGTSLGAGGLSLLAAHGHATVMAYRAPTVAALATGDEIVPSDVVPGPGQLRDSNGPFVAAACRTLGLEARRLGIAPDRRNALQALVAEGLEADVLLLTGGVSMGEFDFVEDVLSELGCDVLFEKVAIQPGKPLVVARHAGGWVLGLPGNPASVMVTFWLFARPLLRRLMGHRDGYWHGALKAQLAAALPGAKARDRFLPARVRFDGGQVLATPLPPRGSHDVAAYGEGSALVRIPAHAAAAAAGEACEVLPLVDWPGESTRR